MGLPSGTVGKRGRTPNRGEGAKLLSGSKSRRSHLDIADRSRLCQGRQNGIKQNGIKNDRDSDHPRRIEDACWLVTAATWLRPRWAPDSILDCGPLEPKASAGLKFAGTAAPNPANSSTVQSAGPRTPP
jgi:hypothetical protein